MAVSEGFRHGGGVDPGVDHCCRVVSEVRSTVVFGLRDRTSVVSLMSWSWLLATNLPVVLELPTVLVVEKIMLVVFLVSTTPSSKEPSSSQSPALGIDDRL